MVRLGIDCDGVLADFAAAYVARYIRITGRNLFHPGDAEDAPCWNWDLYRGYTKEEQTAVWASIVADKAGFWRSLEPLEGAATLRLCIEDLERRHDVYFVTSRVGAGAKRESETWLRRHVGIEHPTVLISSKKGMCAAALKLDAYIDDNYDNAMDVAMARPECKVFLLNKRYNTIGGPELPVETTPPLPDRVRRVGSVGQMLDYLILDL